MFTLQVLASNAIFLGVVILLPFQLGQKVLSITSQLVITTSSALLTSGMSSASELDLALFNITLKNILSSVENMSTSSLTKEFLQRNMSTGVLQSDSGSNFTKPGGSMEILTKVFLSSLWVSYLQLFLSVTWLFSFMFWCYLGLITFICYNKGEPLTVVGSII